MPLRLSPAEILTERVPALDAYVARPAAPGAYPGVVVFHELFGVSAHVRAVAERLAATGHVAIAPNLHHRIEPALELAHDAAGRTRGFALLESLTRDGVLADAGGAVDHLRRRGCERVGLVGLSLGGHVAYLVATARDDLAAVVVAYGGWIPTTDIPLSRPEPTLARTPSITAPMLLLVAGADHAVDAEQPRAVAAALRDAGVRHEVVTWPTAQHGFLCEQRDTYDPEAAADAWARIDGFLAAELWER
ncbi:MAG TPA: dienelactone hydrolase family protein [Baekduia sp.]|nr:dienelactone hydrolase family protein [Baekduia sp.]